MPEELSPQIRQEINDSLFSGRKLQAIKRYREVTGLGLKESKHFVDQLESALRAASPEKFLPSSGIGCGAVILICGSVLTSFAGWCLLA